jgi:hypothetical protein
MLVHTSYLLFASVLSRTGKSAESMRVGQKKVLAYLLTVPGRVTKSAHVLDSANHTLQHRRPKGPAQHCTRSGPRNS